MKNFNIDTTETNKHERDCLDIMHFTVDKHNLLVSTLFKTSDKDKAHLDFLREIFTRMIDFGVDMQSEESVDAFIELGNDIDSVLTYEFKKILDDILSDDTPASEKKYVIDPELLYKDFMITGSDWGTLFAALLSHLHTLKQAEKFTDAIRLCDVLLKYEEPYAQGGPFLIKSDCLIALGRLEEAVAEYEQYILEADKVTDITVKYAYYNLGNLYFELKRYSEARGMFLKAHDIDPSAGGPKGMLKTLETLFLLEST